MSMMYTYAHSLNLKVSARGGVVTAVTIRRLSSDHVMCYHAAAALLQELARALSAPLGLTRGAPPERAPPQFA
jgi:hypothetical protein